MYNSCLICGNAYIPLELNNFPVRKCVKCGLVWRENFNVPDGYYEEKKVNLSERKIKDRLDNCRDRINLFKKCADMNNLCDIGTGEGSFLKALRDFGYKNVAGIEPNGNVSEFAKKNNLAIIKGTLEDSESVIKKNGARTVSMLHIIEHLENPVESLKKIYSFLDKGDKVIIETPNIEAYSFKRAGYKHKLIYFDHLFYFNSDNLKNLLEKTGFKLVAGGKRDFNQQNLGLKTALFRLGVLKNFDYQIESITRKNASGGKKNTRLAVWSGFLGAVKYVLRKALSKMVVFTGRVDCIWVIAQK